MRKGSSFIFKRPKNKTTEITRSIFYEKKVRIYLSTSKNKTIEIIRSILYEKACIYL